MSLLCCDESQHLEAPPGSDPTHNNIIGGESISINKLTYDEVASLKKKQRTLYIQISVLHGKWSIGVPTDFIKIKSIANQLSDLHLMLTSPIEANDEFQEAEKRFEHYNKKIREILEANRSEQHKSFATEGETNITVTTDTVSLGPSISIAQNDGDDRDNNTTRSDKSCYQVTTLNVGTQTYDRPGHRQVASCVVCSKQHLHKDCVLSVDEKLKVVTDKQLCEVCLHTGHRAVNCNRRQRVTCRWCRRLGHSPFLCKQSAAANQPTSARPISDSATNQSTSAEKPIEHAGPSDNAIHVRASTVNNPLCLYKTLIARINGLPVRMLIDEASGRSFITTNLVKKLGLEPVPVRPLPIAVFMQDRAISTADSIVRTTLSNLENSFATEFNPRVVPSIGIGSFGCINDDMRSELSRYGISHHDTADQPVDVIIGLHRAIKLKFTEPNIDLSGNFTAAKTAIGWVVYGGYEEDHDDLADTPLPEVVHSTFLINMEPLYHKIEDNSSELIVSDVVKDFSERIEFDGKHFFVPLPKLHPVRLKCNRSIAHQHLPITLSSFKNRDLSETYNAQMQEAGDNGCVAPVTISIQSGAVNHLPHHAIFGPDKDTIQIRPVFGGSAKDAQHKNLNSNLAKDHDALRFLWIDHDWFPDGHNDIKFLDAIWNTRADALSPLTRTYDTACGNKRELFSVLVSFYDPFDIALPFYLEPLQKPDTASCLLAVRLFFAHRGSLHQIYFEGDPGFKQCQSIIHGEFYKLNKLANDPELAHRGLHWHFAFIYSPWESGQHDHLIRASKDTPQGITFSKQISKSRLMTILAETERIVNHISLYRNEENTIITAAAYLGIGAHLNLPPLSPSTSALMHTKFRLVRTPLLKVAIPFYLTMRIATKPTDLSAKSSDYPLDEFSKTRSTRRMLRIPGQPEDSSPLPDLTPPPPGMLRTATAM